MEYEAAVLRKLQLTEVEVLKAVDALCAKHAIPYFLDSGTALGAARHKGFIPWDDDIDIGMLRHDYDRFLALAPAELAGKYLVGSPQATPHYAPMFAKVWKGGTRFSTQETIEAGFDQGIFIDVFPYDPLHAHAETAKKQVKTCRFWQRISYVYHAQSIIVPHKGILGCAEKALCRVAHGVARIFFSREQIAQSFDKAARKGAENPSDCCMAMAYPIPSGFKMDMLMPTQKGEFEQEFFPVPANIEAYLEILYGATWRELPPLEQRKNHAPLSIDFGEDL